MTRRREIGKEVVEINASPIALNLLVYKERKQGRPQLFAVLKEKTSLCSCLLLTYLILR